MISPGISTASPPAPGRTGARGLFSFRRWVGNLLALLIALFPIFNPGPSRATALLYRISDTDILVGADSFQETDGVEQSPNAVKIHQAGAEFFSIQGKSRVGKTKLIDLVTDPKSRAEKRIDTTRFAPRYQEALIRWLWDTSAVRPDLCRAYMTNGIVITAFQLFGFRDGKPFMETLEFIAEGFGTSVAVRRQEMVFEPGKPTWIPAGVWTQNNPAKDFIITNDPIGRMRFLFDREFRAMPRPGESKLVRPPLDILRISALGARWIQKKPECPEIKPYGSSDSAALSPRR